ncbi:putative nuclease of restriction endonuclease-like (RecB) superfamily [Modicisalibacter xianhensis]|uniref:Putative nuclease of restriction endonuclease-like (RecB) superfamily n=1 Tax=Modicisalibacter xianhensis TaxID=442341 RepID=A0A4R8FB48_9GAMM|nr:PDDEXK nuclease domain-containing protein [Halomonas xianhensis]TDX22940.1 putative nuclease of restriction endonuclease-like (RecB) superfamily [Halomonas xianhensis]
MSREPARSPQRGTISPHLVAEIRHLVAAARREVVQAVNSTMVQTYWHIGRLIVEDEQQGEARAAYGKQQLQGLSETLTAEFGKGFDVRNLRNMRAFYQTFPIRNAVRTELSWTHYRVLLRVESDEARQWYQREAIEQGWSARALERQVSRLYYERLLSSRDRVAVEQEAQERTQELTEHGPGISPKHYLRDPYLLDFLNLPGRRYLEADLERGLIDNLQAFLLELGKGFAFVARQQRISTEDQDFYIDLVFYNFKLKCFLLIDLKLGKLTHQDVGQMDSYIRIYDQHRKGDDDNPTIGLILCSQKSEAVVKYSVLTDSEQMFAAKYMPYLPSEEELRHELERERELVQQQISQTIKEVGDNDS